MTNRLNDLHVFPAELFDWKKNGTEWTGVSELSDLGGAPFNRLYGEKAGCGFAVQGKQKKLVFYINEIVRDSRENEILHYVMKCISDPNFKIIIFND